MGALIEEDCFDPTWLDDANALWAGASYRPDPHPPPDDDPPP